MGSSVTWGAGIGNGALADRKTFAYPWLLSPNASNFAIRAGGPNYPATCTATMIGEGVYDVFVLEYFMRAKDGLATLSRRIRERFPDAIIIFLLNWDPSIINHCSNPECTGPNTWMFDWVKEKGFDLQTAGGLHDERIKELFSEERNETFSFAQLAMPNKINVVLDAARAVGGYVAPMPGPEHQR